MPRTNNSLLKVEDLRISFDYLGQISRAVDGISFQVFPGEAVGIVGESGCGKTVSALSIMGLLPVPPAKIESGKIVFNNIDLFSLEDIQMQKIRGKQISMIFQDPLTSLNPVFTVENQLKEAILTHENLQPRALKQRCLKLLREVGLPDPENRLKNYPHQLSGGQRQRVMIAMAMACNPYLIIADEPTTALDVTIQAQIINLLKSVQRRELRSVLYITHDLALVSNFADRIYVMYAGVIVEEGKSKQIFSNPLHPYTRGLLDSLPTLGKKGKKLASIPGSVPSPAYKPSGCPFNPRCFARKDECTHAFPPLLHCGGEHYMRCPVLYADCSN